MTYNEFLKYGTFGCPDCYKTFNFVLDGYLKKIQGNCEHTGKEPLYGGETVHIPLITADADHAEMKDAEQDIAFTVDAGSTEEELRPALKLTLLDSLNKRIKFLQEVVDRLKLSEVQCIHGRAEEGARNKALREKFDVAVSRAVARLQVLAEYCMPFVRVGGYFVALKGMKYAQESQEGQRAVKMLGGKDCRAVPVHLPSLEDKRAVLYIQKLKNTPKAYPRKAGTPDKNPL